MTQTETQPEMNLGVIELVSYVQDFKEAKKAFQDKEKAFLERKFKLFEERLIKKLPKDFTSLFSIKVTDIRDCPHRAEYPFDKDADLEEWWQSLPTHPNCTGVKLAVVLTSVEKPEFTLHLAAVLKEGGSYQLQAQLEAANSFTRTIPTIYEPGKIDYLQAYVAEKFSKAYSF